MDEASFDSAARTELARIEDALADVDPDDIEVSTSDGVLRLDLRDGTKIVINSHRAARQIWMAAERNAWHFDWDGERSAWVAKKNGDELWSALSRVLTQKLGKPVSLSRN